MLKILLTRTHMKMSNKYPKSTAWMTHLFSKVIAHENQVMMVFK